MILAIAPCRGISDGVIGTLRKLNNTGNLEDTANNMNVARVNTSLFGIELLERCACISSRRLRLPVVAAMVEVIGLVG